MGATRTSFRPGKSGNPSGRPAGSRNRATVALDTLLDGQASALTSKAVELALSGDTVALRMCMDRIMPARKERPIRFALPPIEGPGDAVKANAALVAAVASGELTPGEAAEMAKLVDNVTRAIAASDFAARLTKLEEALIP